MTIISIIYEIHSEGEYNSRTVHDKFGIFGSNKNQNECITNGVGKKVKKSSSFPDKPKSMLHTKVIILQ